MTEKEQFMTNTKQWSKPTFTVSRVIDARNFSSAGALDASASPNFDSPVS